MSRIGWLTTVLACLCILALPAAAPAAIRAKTTLQSASGTVRLVVKLTSTRSLTASTRPRSVKVKGGGKTYTLSRARGTSMATVSAGTWRSAVYRGRSAAGLSALAGKSVKVLVTSRAGTATVNSAVPRAPGPISPGPGPAPNPSAQPLFQPPGRELTGEETRPFLQRYLVNSRFTDCPGVGWPSCSVEERYNHCPDGSWEYHRLTPSSGSDIHAYGTAQVTGAVVHADGSWVVEYNQSGYGTTNFYHWEVATNGRVVGSYNHSQVLGPLQYQQPANCGAP